MEVRVRKTDWTDGISVLIRQNLGGKRYIAEPLTLRELEEVQYVEPTFNIDQTEAQILMDDLWSAGIRPTEGAGSAGSLKATQNHLEDMRKIAFKRLSIPG